MPKKIFLVGKLVQKILVLEKIFESKKWYMKYNDGKNFLME